MFSEAPVAFLHTYSVLAASQLSCTCRYRTQARRKQDTYVCTHVRTYLVHPPGTCALISSCERASPPCAPHCAFSFREGHSPLRIPPCAPAGEANTHVHLFFDSAAVPSCGRPSPFAPGAYVRTRGSRGRARLRRAPQVPPEGGGEVLLRTCQAIARLSKALAPRKSCY